jgi:glycosyltransferase involved in cell wall biosynthesis
MSVPRVLHIGKFYPPHHGGMESHLEVLCQGLRGEVDPHVLVTADGRRTVAELRDGIPVTRVGAVATLASASFSPGMAAHIRRARPRLVHFHHPNPTGALSLLASGWRGPLVVTYHSDIVRQRVLGALISPLTHAVLRRAAAILVSSPPYLESSPTLRRHRERCRVVPFGVDTDLLQDADAAKVASLRQSYGPRVVLGAGRLVYYKGFEYLVRAMQGVDGHLLLAGEGPLGGSLRTLAAQLGIADRITFLGSVPDLRPYLHACDVFALPSVERSEAFGLVQLEAMSCGKPVVNTALPSGVPWVSRHGETGLTVPPRDADALGTALRTLLDDGALAARLGAAGRHRAVTELTVDRMVRGTLDAYREALAGHPSSRQDRR